MYTYTYNSPRDKYKEWLEKQDKQMRIPTEIGNSHADLRISEYKWEKRDSNDANYYRYGTVIWNNELKPAQNSYCLISGEWKVENKYVGQKDSQQRLSKRLRKDLERYGNCFSGAPNWRSL
tara:strand:- start:17751 stop:18113 length:363 start_codon:yes stop_codon:yes gene_type:complete